MHTFTDTHSDVVWYAVSGRRCTVRVQFFISVKRSIVPNQNKSKTSLSLSLPPLTLPLFYPSLSSYKSVDGRSTPLLGGTNPSTPQPSSPDPSHFPLLQDYSSAPSPSPSSPVSPELLMLSHIHTPASRDSHRLLSNEDTRCSTPDTSFDETVEQQQHC